MHIFYTPDVQGESYTLSEAESKHCVKVLRLSEGDTINLVDGKGGLYQAEIALAHPKKCQLAVKQTKKAFEKKSYYLHIAIAPTKSINRFEWFLEKATEIGIDEISPLLTQNSERTVLKTERLQKIITSAMKQSVKAYRPKLNQIQRYIDFLNSSANYNTAKLIATCNDTNKVPLKDVCTNPSELLILIGPEGDFSPDEIELAIKNRFQPVSLGSSRLRTETAGIAACHTVMLMKENSE